MVIILQSPIVTILGGFPLFLAPPGCLASPRANVANKQELAHTVRRSGRTNESNTSISIDGKGPFGSTFPSCARGPDDVVWVRRGDDGLGLSLGLDVFEARDQHIQVTGLGRSKCGDCGFLGRIADDAGDLPGTREEKRCEELRDFTMSSQQEYSW